LASTTGGGLRLRLFGTALLADFDTDTDLLVDFDTGAGFDAAAGFEAGDFVAGAGFEAGTDLSADDVLPVPEPCRDDPLAMQLPSREEGDSAATLRRLRLSTIDG